MEELENSAVQSTSGWYESVSLEDAELYIHANLKSAARSVIAIGYYLKCVNRNELFKEAGYKDICEYAKDRFGFSASTTSRYMTRNDKFSVNGNSPILDEKYKDFNKSQLQEMLSLDVEQLEKVTPDMTVVQIREMKKPKEVPYVAIPGQIELTDFPGVEPEDVAAAAQAREGIAASSPGKQAYTISAEDLLPDAAGSERPVIAISQQEQPEKTGKCIHRPEFDCTLEEAHKLIPGTGENCSRVCCWECVKHGDCNLECYSSARRPVPMEHRRAEHDTTSDCPAGIQDCQRQEWGTSPEEQASGRKECEKCWTAWKRRQNKPGAAEVKQEPAAEHRIVWNTEDEGHHIREAYCNAIARKLIESHYDWFRQDTASRVLQIAEAEKQYKARFRPGGSSRWYFTDPIVGSKVASVNLFDDYIQFWSGDNEWLGDCEWFYLCSAVQGMWNVIATEKAIEDAKNKQEEPEEEKLPDPDEDWGIGELPQAKELYLKQLARVLMQECGNELRMTPGEIGRPSDDTIRKQTDMLRIAHNGIVGLDDGVDAFPSEDMIEFFRDGADLGVCSHDRFATQVRRALEDADKAILSRSRPPEPETVSEPVGTVSDTPETVIDGEFTEVQEPEEYTPQYFLEEQKSKLERFVAASKGVQLKPADVKILERQKMIVCALAAMVCDLDLIENPPPKPDQPELPQLKNNDQRAAFVDAYETWPLWIETVQTGERYYRYDLDDGTSMVVKVYQARLFDGFAAGSYESRYHEGYGRHEYYLLQPGKFFRDCETNRSLLIEKLKEIQKVKRSET